MSSQDIVDAITDRPNMANTNNIGELKIISEHNIEIIKKK